MLRSPVESKVWLEPWAGMAHPWEPSMEQVRMGPPCLLLSLSLDELGGKGSPTTTRASHRPGTVGRSCMGCWAWATAAGGSQLPPPPLPFPYHPGGSGCGERLCTVQARDGVVDSPHLQHLHLVSQGHPEELGREQECLKWGWAPCLLPLSFTKPGTLLPLTKASSWSKAGAVLGLPLCWVSQGQRWQWVGPWFLCPETNPS